MISMMALGLFVVMTILTGTGNVIGATYRFAWIPSLVLGCVAPRAAMYVLVIFATFLDVPKKLLVIANVLHMDFRIVRSDSECPLTGFHGVVETPQPL